MIMRPDEKANQSEIERDERFRSNVNKGVATAASLGSAAVGAGVAGRIMPFLSKYVPVDLAMKGISKISPKLGDFLKRGQSMGLNVEEGLSYVKDQLTPKKEEPKEQRNIIEQYSPELHQFIISEMQQGRSPMEAGALASMEGKSTKGFKSAIDKIVKDHKAPWSAILQTVYGDQGVKKGQQQQPNQPHPNSAKGQQMARQEAAQQQPGQGQAALMAILQKLQQSRGGQ